MVDGYITKQGVYTNFLNLLLYRLNLELDLK